LDEARYENYTVPVRKETRSGPTRGAKKLDTNPERSFAFVRARWNKCMATIHKKVWREYFEKIISGKKKLELRLADFEINEGDTLVLEEWDKDKKDYTGRRIEVIATYILKTKD
jgi:hypothetical protein